MPEVSIKIISQSFIAPEALFHSGGSLETALDIGKFLRNPKNLKFMAKQDKLIIASVHQLLESAQLSKEDLKERTGIYLCVGALPFEESELNKLAHHSEKEGVFDIEKFSNDTFNSINPLLTFKCLPNMTIFHVSNNFEIHQAYFITYPGQFQWAQALQRAIADLKEGEVDYAIVGAVADQRNPLVKQYINKLGGSDTMELLDVAGTWLLTTKNIPCISTIDSLEVNYEQINYFSDYRISHNNSLHLGPVAGHFDYLTWLNTKKEKQASLLFKEGCYSYEMTFTRGER